MKVAFFVPSFPATSETFILNQVTGLQDRGHKVDLFAYRPPEPGPMHDVVMQRDLTRLVRLMPHRSDRVRLREVLFRTAFATAAAPRCLRGDYAAAVGGWPTLIRTLGRLAAEGRYDVVHCHYGHIGLRYRVAARYWKAPLVTSFYGHDSSAYPVTHGPRAFEPLFRDVAAVTSLSAHMDAQLRALGCEEERLHRVPLPVDTEHFRLTARNRDPGDPARILTVGRLTEKKGIEYALRAIARLGTTSPEVYYDVVGEGPLRRELEELTVSLGIAERVRFLGARNSDEVRAAMLEADIFLLPSVIAASGDEEGTPTVLIEASLCGLPVVSTRHAGIPELVLDGESGYLVAERDSEALADVLGRLLREPATWRAMGMAGRRHVERQHAREAVATRLERLYIGVSDRGRGPEHS